MRTKCPIGHKFDLSSCTFICHSVTFLFNCFENKANNIANCADGKSSVESYGCAWVWDDDVEDGVDTDDQGKQAPQGGDGRRRRPRNDRPLVQDNAHKVSGVWSTLLFSPRNCCGGGSNDDIPFTEHNDEAYNDKFMEEF